MLKYKKPILYATLWALVVSVPSDVLAVSINIWTFPPSNLLGLYIMSVPIEEYIFITCLALLLSTSAIILKVRYFKPSAARGGKK